MISRKNAGWIAVLAIALLHQGTVRAQSQQPARHPIAEIEMAWLADPITFPFALRVVPTATAFEIHGAVPSAAVKKQALNIARIHGQATITDRVNVVALGKQAAARRAPDDLRKDLEQRLREIAPALAKSILIQTDEEGRVTLTGSTNSWDEKRSLGQALRSIPGCICVVNQLQFAGAPTADDPGIVTAHASIPVKLGNPSAERFARPIANETTDAIRRNVAAAFPRLRAVQVAQVGPRRFQIQVLADNDLDGTTTVRHIFAMPELRNVHLDVYVHVPE